MNITLIIIYTLLSAASSISAMHFLQLCSYRPERGYFKLFATRECKISLICAAIFAVFYGIFGQASAFFFIAIQGFLLTKIYKKKRKPPYKRTKRILRQTFTNLLIFAGLNALWLPLGMLTCHFVPLLSLTLNKPVEALISRHYIRTAHEKLKRSSAIKLLITGSYGKTTVKSYLKTLLEDRYNVLVTPESYNTPLGIALTVNNSLNESVDIFIAEAGARQRGDIAELCRIVEPDVGILTGISPQHLQTFGSLENVLKTKLELFDYLTTKPSHPKKSLNNATCQRDREYYSNDYSMIFGCDNLILTQELQRRKLHALPCGKEGKVTVKRLQLNNTKENYIVNKYLNASSKNTHSVFNRTESIADVTTKADATPIENVESIIERGLKLLNDGATCEISFGDERATCECGVWGNGELSSLSIAVGAALTLGLSLNEIAESLKKIKPVKHRGDIIFNNGLFIIDDSYNCSEASADSSIKKLSELGSNRFCITAGIVEGGNQEYELNRALGVKLAQVCEAVCIVGVNSRALRDGLLDGGLHEKQILSATSPENGVMLLKPFLKRGDALLFLNDLTDNYI